MARRTCTDMVVYREFPVDHSIMCTLAREEGRLRASRGKAACLQIRVVGQISVHVHSG